MLLMHSLINEAEDALGAGLHGRVVKVVIDGDGGVAGQGVAEQCGLTAICPLRCVAL